MDSFGFQGGGGISPADLARITTLENNELKILYFTAVNSATGTITAPANSTIILNDFPQGLDAVVETIVNGVPTGLSPTTAGGVTVTVTSFDASGNYVLSGVPSAYPVAILYILKVKSIYYSNLNFDNIIESQVVDAATVSYVNAELLQKADKEDGLVSGGAITVGSFGANNVRVAPAVWYITPLNYTTVANSDFSVALAASGLQRFTGFYGDNTNTITKVEGTESEYAAYPTTPVGTALIGYLLVTDSSVSTTPDLSGYLLIASKATAADIIAGTDNTKYATSSVMQGIVAKYQNLSTTTAVTLNTNVANYRDTFSSITALASAMAIAAPTGTPLNGTKLWFRIKDNGTARALTWNAAFVNTGGTLPTTTVVNKLLNVGLVYNSVTLTWNCVASITEL